jgi:hypothetical protein
LGGSKILFFVAGNLKYNLYSAKEMFSKSLYS